MCFQTSWEEYNAVDKPALFCLTVALMWTPCVDVLLLNIGADKWIHHSDFPSAACVSCLSTSLDAHAQTKRQSHTQTCHSPRSSSSLMNQTIRHKVGCKQRQLAQCVMCFRVMGMREGHIAIFRHRTTHWSHWDWLGFRWNGSFHTGGEGRRGENEDVCVYVCVWVQMRQCFRNRKRVWKKELAEHRAFDFTLEI